jgi:hypothetical protein
MPDTPAWGPVYPCPDCGTPLRRLVANAYPGGFRTFEAGTTRRHHCPARPIPPLDDIFECLCGEVVAARGGRKYDYRHREMPHVCSIPVVSIVSDAPPEPATTRPVVRPATPPAPNGHRPPRLPPGVIER